MYGGDEPQNLEWGMLIQTGMWANANVMAALPNIGGALCSTPQTSADAHY